MRLLRTLLLLVAFAGILAGAPASAQISILGMKNSLVQFALSQISVEGELEITAEGVEEPEDGVTSLVGVEISDGEGVWLKAERFDLRWNASRILRGELEINELAARGVEVLRAPNPPQVAVKEGSELEEETAGFDPFEWPRLPLTTRVERLVLERVQIAGGVIAAQSLGFEAEGRFQDEGDEQSLHLDLRRTDSVEGTISLDYVRDFSDESLTLNLAADEAPGGLVAEMAGLPEDAASTARIDASGPLVDWRLTLAAEAERMMAVQGGATINARAPIAADVRLSILPGPELAEQTRAAIGEEARLDVSVQETDEGVIRIAEGRFSSSTVTASATGEFVREEGAMDFALSLLARRGLAAVAEGVDFEQVGFEGTLKGATDDFNAVGALTLADLQTAAADVGAAELQVDVGMAAGIISAKVDGGARQVRLDKLGPDLLGETTLLIQGAYDMTAERADLATLRIASPLLSLEASGAVEVGASTAVLDYSLDTPDLAPVAAAYGQEAGGRLTAKGHLDGPFDALHLVGGAEALDLVFQQESWGRVTLQHDITAGEVIEGTASVTATEGPLGEASVSGGFTMDGDLLTLRDFTAQALEATATGALEVDLAKTLAEGELEIDAPRLAAFSDLAGEPLTGSVSGAVRLSKPEDRQDAQAELSGENLSGFGAGTESFSINVQARDLTGEGDAEGALTVSGLTAEGARVGGFAATFAGKGLLGGEPSAALKAEAEDVSAPDDLGTIAHLTLEAEGADLKLAPRGNAKMRAEGLAGLGGPDVNGAVATLTLDAEGENLMEAPKGTVSLVAETLSGMEAELARLTLDAEGENLMDAPRVNATIKAESFAGFGAEIASLTLDAQGRDLIEAPAAEAEATIDALTMGAMSVRTIKLTASGENLVEDPKGQAKVDASAVTLAEGVTVQAVNLTAQGETLISSPKGEAVIVANGLVAEDLVSLPRTTLEAKGGMEALTVRLRSSGTTFEERPLTVNMDASGALQGEAAEFRVSQLAVEAGPGAAEGEDAFAVRLGRPLVLRRQGDDWAAQNIDIELPGGGLTGNATLHPAGASGQLELSMADVSVPARLAKAPVDGGRLDLSARFDTRASSPSATIDLSAAGLEFADIPSEAGGLDIALAGRWNGRTLNADGTINGGFGDAVTLDAALPLVPSGGPVPVVPANARLDSNLIWKGRVESIWPLLPLPDHVLTGDLDLDIKVVGTIDDPQPSGSVSLRDGSYQNLETGTIMTDLEVSSALAEGGGIEVTLNAHDGAQGPIQAQVTLKGPDINGFLKTDKAVLMRREDVTASVSADIKVAGPLTEFDVTGGIVIDRAEVRLVNATPPSLPDLGEVVVKGQKRERRRGEREAGPRLDLTVKAPGGIFVRGRGLVSEWEVDLAIKGRASSPRITGAVQKRRGTLDFLGRDFNLERGRVSFSGGREIDPQLDVALVHERDDITGIIAVRGRVSDPQIAFESRPGLPEDEVLPRVIFGSSSQSLSAAEGIQLAAGVATLMGGNEGVLGRVRSAIGLDVLSVDTTGEGTDVKAGQNLTEDVYVGVKQPVDGGSASVQVEVEVYDNVTVDGETGSEDGTSVGLNWKYDF